MSSNYRIVISHLIFLNELKSVYQKNIMAHTSAKRSQNTAVKSKTKRKSPVVAPILKIGKVSQNELIEYPTVSELHDAIHNPNGPMMGYCKLDCSGPSQEQILTNHMDSISHCLIPEFKGTLPGSTSVIKNCVHLSTKFLLSVAHLLPSDGSSITHINRGWSSKKPRFFQGIVNTDGLNPELCTGPFRFLPTTQIPANAAVVELPTVNPGDNAILFMYAGVTDEHGTPTGHSYPHGIATSGVNTAKDWHAEPGGAIVICLTENTPNGSAGLYLTPPDTTTMNKVHENHIRRMDEEYRGVYMGIHDSRLLRAINVSIYTKNYICATANALPVTWAGNHISDPLSMKGNGRVHNQHKVSGAFKLREGFITIHELMSARWPNGVRPPQDLYDWAVQHNYKFCTSFLKEAHEYPANFLMLFPTFSIFSNFD